MRTRSLVRDRATRERLLETAARLFTERGFRKVTVRDISRQAAANVAAINYHFGDKLGLYEEVVRLAAARTASAACNGGPSGNALAPHEQLRAYVRRFLGHLMSEEDDAWMDKLIGRELADPTPGFEQVVEQGLKPSSLRLADLVSQVLRCAPNDERVWQCTVSIQAQCLFYRNSPMAFARLAPRLKLTPEVIDRIAEHITDFSLGGLRSLAEAGKGPS